MSLNRITLPLLAIEASEEEVELETLRWHLLHAEAERDDALWTIERIGQKAEIIEHWNKGETLNLRYALTSIRIACMRALTPRVDGGRG